MRWDGEKCFLGLLNSQRLKSLARKIETAMAQDLTALRGKKFVWRKDFGRDLMAVFAGCEFEYCCEAGSLKMQFYEGESNYCGATAVCSFGTLSMVEGKFFAHFTKQQEQNGGPPYGEPLTTIDKKCEVLFDGDTLQIFGQTLTEKK